MIELLEARALAHHAPIANLGPDLIDDAFDETEAFRRFRDPGRAGLTIGDAIMDQKIMAGAATSGSTRRFTTAASIPGGWCPSSMTRRFDRPQGRASCSRVRRQPGPDGVAPRRPTMGLRRAGLPCRRCFTRLRSNRQLVDIRRTAWCPKCQPLAEGQAVQPPKGPLQRCLEECDQIPPGRRPMSRSRSVGRCIN